MLLSNNSIILLNRLERAVSIEYGFRYNLLDEKSLLDMLTAAMIIPAKKVVRARYLFIESLDYQQREIMRSYGLTAKGIDLDEIDKKLNPETNRKSA